MFAEDLRPTHKTSCDCQYCATRRELLVGGRADGKKSSDFDPIQLKKGIAHEMEHTNDPRKAEEIAKDHLSEDPKYYDHLDTMEYAVKSGKPVVYAASVEGTAKFLKAMVDDGRPKVEDMGLRMQHEEIERVGGEVRTELHKAEKANEISSRDADKFMRGDFTELTKDYMAGDIDRDKYRTEMKRLLDRHLQQHSKSLTIFSKEQKKQQQSEQPQSIMPYSQQQTSMPAGEQQTLPFNPLVGDEKKGMGAFTFFARKQTAARGRTR